MAEAVSSNLEAYGRKLREYLSYRTNVSPGVIVRKKAQSLTFALFNEAKKAAPSKADIEAAALEILKRFETAAKYHEVKFTRVELLQMVRAELNRRIQAIRYVATGYLPAVQASRARVNASNLPAVQEPHGDYRDHSSEHNPYIAIVNSTPGVTAANDKHGIVAAALRSEIGDMDVFIERELYKAGMILKRF